jgi:RNA polymerase sigma-70 factor (ECF subfamily)
VALERFELVRAVHAAIARLERPYREVLIMRDLEGLSGPETCALLGLELSAMKTRLHRARSQLREQLGPRSPQRRLQRR